MRKHATIGIFIPHAGCPRQCSFCDQHQISGEEMQPSPNEAEAIVEDAIQKLSDNNKPAQIGFFGGSFTALNLVYMEELLQHIQKYIDYKNYSGIRISTRPDAIDEKILEILKKYNVTDIELGAQSMDDLVLQANLRGHSAQDTVNAARLIKKYGFGLGLQVMTGLYKDSTDKSIVTANTVISLNPDCVRIYPTVILRGTILEQLYQSGEYAPQKLEEAVELCSGLLGLFTDAGIPVIKLGLHDSPGLKQNIIAGPHHPAFRELCESRILLNKSINQIKRKQIPKGNILLHVNNLAMSKMAGQQRENILKLQSLGYGAKIVLSDKIKYLQVEVSKRV